MSKILIAVDASEYAMYAFNYYHDVIHRQGNEVIVLHCPDFSKALAKELNDAKNKDGGLNQEQYNKLLQKEREKWEELERKYKVQFMSDKTRSATFKIVHGKPGEAIVEAAREEKVDMVVTGTRGLSGFTAKLKRMVGSVSDYVVHHAPCPVMVVREN